jgi:hypothetical protein
VTSSPLPYAPTTGRRGLPTVPPAGPYWRIWHPTTHTTAANVPRTFGPLHRFDPHPPGPPADHKDVFVLYGSLAFEVSALEVFHRGPPGFPGTVDVCPNWRGTLVGAPAPSRLFDLTDEDATHAIGATPRLGDTKLDRIGYAVTQGWGRFFHASPGVHGLRYFSCRASDRSGVAVALFRKAAIGPPGAQHLLIDDALWPYFVYTLDTVGVGINQVPHCPRCRRAMGS